MEFKWWAFKKLDGSVYVRMCVGIAVHESIMAKMNDPGVCDGLLPFCAQDRDEAETTAAEFLISNITQDGKLPYTFLTSPVLGVIKQNCIIL